MGRQGPKKVRMQAWAMSGQPWISQPKSEKGNLKARVADNQNVREQNKFKPGFE